jgi:predicted ATPase with chaperone activity
MFPHHDLPIALGLILAIGAIPPDALEAVNWIAEMTAPIERLG